jgi:amphi-Trp domain-containing protein
VVEVVDHEYTKNIDKKEMIEFLRKLADGIEGNKINIENVKDFSIKKPYFTLEYEVKEKEYGKKLEIEIQMKDYD